MDGDEDEVEEVIYIKDIIAIALSSISIIISIVSYFKSRKLEKTVEQKKKLKERILRYFENGQKQADGSFAPNRDYILAIFKNGNPVLVREALSELVNEEYLEYQDGCYYLKGRAPQF